jgi:hypothetical protein
MMWSVAHGAAGPGVVGQLASCFLNRTLLTMERGGEANRMADWTRVAPFTVHTHAAVGQAWLLCGDARLL